MESDTGLESSILLRCFTKAILLGLDPGSKTRLDFYLTLVVNSCDRQPNLSVSLPLSGGNLPSPSPLSDWGEQKETVWDPCLGWNTMSNQEKSCAGMAFEMGCPTAPPVEFLEVL